MDATLNNQVLSRRWHTVVGWGVVAAVCGLACVVVPPHLFLAAKPAYGTPLIHWFAFAIANLSFVTTLISMAILGFVLGVAQPRWWPLSCFLTASLVIVLNAMNVVHDWTIDPTTHNLFPFEFAFLLFLSLPAFVFGLVGSVVRKAIHRNRSVKG